MKTIVTTAMVLGLFVSLALAQNPEPPAAQGAGATATQGSSSAANSAGGASVGAVLDKTVDAKKAKEGDPVIAKTLQELKSADGQVIPRNSKLIGHVTQVQARGKGQDQSTLGIVFDKIQVGKEKEMPFHAVIQALAPPPAAALAGDTGGTSAGAAGPTAPGSGGTTGGVNATGAPMGHASSAGSIGSNSGGSSGDEGGGVAMPRGASGDSLTSTSQGAIGMKDVQLSASQAGGSQASILTSTHSNVKLESGTRLVLRLSAQ